MPTILHNAAEKRTLIKQWEATAIGLKDAEERDLVRYSSMTCWRNWTCREALYDFAQQSAQARPILVRVDHKRMALFTPRRSQ
ncbi:hypothetical protein [Prosthecobacter fusiformis]|nr:hypothetical protein [Prosthecobacter fusiformis]